MSLVTKYIKFLSRYSNKRTIMTTSARAEEAVEKLKSNPYFEKYSKKITELKKTSPEEFLTRVEDRENQKTLSTIDTVKERQYSSLLQPKADTPSPISVKDKCLSDIMKLELVSDKDHTEIKRIWEEYHLQKDVICGTMTVELYNSIESRSKIHGTFVFPLPRSQGYEFIMCQFARNAVYFTPLLCYQVHKENAPECLTIVHYTELKEKGLVLMRGEFDKNIIDAKEAQCLANQLQLYYGQQDPTRTLLLETFTSNPSEFKHMDLIAQLEHLTL